MSRWLLRIRLLNQLFSVVPSSSLSAPESSSTLKVRAWSCSASLGVRLLSPGADEAAVEIEVDEADSAEEEEDDVTDSDRLRLAACSARSFAARSWSRQPTPLCGRYIAVRICCSSPLFPVSPGWDELPAGGSGSVNVLRAGEEGARGDVSLRKSARKGLTGLDLVTDEALPPASALFEVWFAPLPSELGSEARVDSGAEDIIEVEGSTPARSPFGRAAVGLSLSAVIAEAGAADPEAEAAAGSEPASFSFSFSRSAANIDGGG